eukprot:gene9909-12152_t
MSSTTKESNNNKNDIVVVGASNWDMFTYCNKIPVIGETIKGNDFKVSFGGKAANQAVQAALLGSKTTIITKLGDDVFGQNTIENFKNRGVSHEYVQIVKGVPSGCATIIVDSHGNNNIIIVGGSNDKLSVKDIQDAQSIIHQSKYLLCQLEVNLDVTKESLKIAKQSNCKTILNVSPTIDDPILNEMIDYVDIMIVNEVELANLSHVFIGLGKTMNQQDLINIEKAAVKLFDQHKNLNNIIVTLGQHGSCLLTRNSPVNHIPIEKQVKVVDTTGAGDSFTGSLAHFLSSGIDMIQSIKNSMKVASLSVQKFGSQSSYSSINDPDLDL